MMKLAFLVSIVALILLLALPGEVLMSRPYSISPDNGLATTKKRAHHKTRFSYFGISLELPILSSPIRPYQALLDVKMADRMAFLLFGDQSLNVHETLADFYHREDSGALSNSFLEHTATVLRDEVDGLSNVERLRIPTFSTIQDLNSSYNAQSRKNSALDSALLCITQLLLYIE